MNKRTFGDWFCFAFGMAMFLLIRVVYGQPNGGGQGPYGSGLTSLPGLVGQIKTTNRVIYVDSLLGDDAAGNGTQEKPFKTIGYQFSDAEGTHLFTKGGALGVAQPGDTIKLSPGDYTNEVVQLWIAGTNGVSLIGDHRNGGTRLWPGLHVSFGNGEGLVQLGNNIVVRDVSFPRTTNPNWFNPISDGGKMWATVYWNDAVGGAGAFTNFQFMSCTNVLVQNVDGFGHYDGVFLQGGLDYDVTFANVDMAGRWDQFAVYGRNTNRINRTVCYNCTFSPEGGGDGQNGNVVHCVDIHGGDHLFYNCTFKARNGGTRTSFSSGGTYGAYIEDGFSLSGQTNSVKFNNCIFDTSSTNGGSVDLTNFSSAAGKSKVFVLGGIMDDGKSSGYLGYAYSTNGTILTARGPTGTVSMNDSGAAICSGGMVAGNSGFNVSSSGDISLGGGKFSASATDGSISADNTAIQSDGAGLLLLSSLQAGGSVSAASLAVGSITITTGSAAPSSSEPDGSIYLRTGATASTTLYVRAGGAWTAVTVP